MRLILVLILLTAPAWAWFEEFHEVVAEIAWPDVRPEVRQRIEAVMLTHPDPAARTFKTGCSWPDAVKKTERPDTFGWHFVNRPYGDGPPAAEPNAATIIPWLLTEIAAGRDLPQNLAYLGHLVGDVHQPLHAVNHYTAEFPHGDQGGGRVKLPGGGNLHQYWDGLAGLEVTPDLAERLRAAHPRSSFPRVEAPLATWLDESYQAAVDVVYRYPADPVTTRAVAERRLVLAGYRLADMLNRLVMP